MAQEGRNNYMDEVSGNWQQFTEDTTMHGIHRVRMKDSSLLRRFIWSFVILAGVGYFTFAASNFLKAFTEKRVTTSIRVENAENLTFPTLTICNRNYWVKSRMKPDILSAEQNQITDELMSLLYFSQDLPPPEGMLNWSDPLLRGFSRESGFTPQEVEAFMISLAHSFDETFIQCQVMRQIVDCKDVIQQVKTDSGYCYQFNGDGTLQTHTAGLSGGITFVLNALVDEYYIGPYSFSEGFSIAVHDSSQVPLLSELSYGAQPGQESHFNLQRKEIKREPPYADAGRSDCFDTVNRRNPLHFYDVYSYSACKSECQVSYVIRKCGCRGVFDPDINNTRPCIIQDMIECSMPASVEFQSNGEHLKSCGCKPTCNEVQYTARISSYKYPSRLVGEVHNCNKSCLEHSRDNIVLVHFVYGEMSYEYLEEDVTYTGDDLISNLGGTLGVCLGASFLTIIEFIEFGVIQLFLLMNRSTKRRNQNSVSAVETKVKPFDE